MARSRSLEVRGLDDDGAVWSATDYGAGPDASWSAWTQFRPGGAVAFNQLAVASQNTPCLQLWRLSGDGTLYTSAQSPQDGTWSAWTT